MFQLVRLLKSKRVLFLIFLSGCASIFLAKDVPLALGIGFNFASVFLFFIIRIYNLKIAIVATIISYLFSVVYLEYPVWNIIPILEVIFVGICYMRSRIRNIVLLDALFWICIGMPIYFLFYTYGMGLSPEMTFFQISKDGINGLGNAFLADIMLTYIPFSRWIGNRDKRKYVIFFPNFIFHMMLLAVIFPFVLSICLTSYNANEEVHQNTYRLGIEAADSIEKELDKWSKEDIRKLLLYGTIQKGYLEEKINKFTTEEILSVVVTNSDGRVLSSTTKSIDPKEYYDWKNATDIARISANFYESTPIVSNSVLPLVKWSKGNYIYEREIKDSSLRIYIQFPISQFQNTIFKEYNQQGRFVFLFGVFVIVVVVVINRTMTKTLRELAEMTTKLPQKIQERVEITWPTTRISEFNSITTNIQHMSSQIKQMFEESNEMNKQLAVQAEMLQQSREKLHTLAYYDTLTELPNRLFFQQFLSDILMNMTTPNMAVIFVDLDKFKHINDTLGHKVGDELLQYVGRKLSALQSQTINVFRLGGDEFVMTIQFTEVKEVERIGNDIINVLSHPIHLEEHQLHITPSVGISLFPYDGRDMDTLVKHADMAMYRSKGKGGNQVQFFNDEIKEEFLNKFTIETSIRQAIEKKEFKLHYQPKINTQTGAISSAEVLIRWTSPTLGVVSPAEFIPIAEESALIIAIEKWVLLEACKQNKEWQEAGYLKIPFAVNISAKHFAQEDFFEEIKQVLTDSQLESKYLSLEITERVLIDNVGDVTAVIMKLNELGVGVSIDDFGKGYSSLSQLLTLPISEVKIDKDFISNVEDDEKKAAVVKYMVNLAHSLQLNVVAEGIEREEERMYLKMIQCDELQGYLFSKPLSGEEFMSFANKLNRSKG